MTSKGNFCRKIGLIHENLSCLINNVLNFIIHFFKHVNPVYSSNYSNGISNEIPQNSDKKKTGSVKKLDDSIEKSQNNLNEVNDSKQGNAEKPQKARKYITLPGGKRKWIRILPPKVRGKDKKPRKKGKEHGNWKHGLGKTREYDSEKYAAWKEAVLRNCNFRCLVTGKTDKLNCHHLNSWDWYEEGRYDAANGVAITVDIHKEFHAKYGSGQNTFEEFEHFLFENYNMTLNDRQYGNHEPRFTTESVSQDLQRKQQEKQADLIELINSRNHELVSGIYKKSSSVIVIRCKIHDVIHETTATNYKKSKTGMSCCGRQRQSQATAYYNTLR
uniref:Putative site-specific DNA endonuclease n=1 Tax=Schizomeris leibleinii TaxID=104533 RepID=F8SY81_9CHLO|nr:Putative site-specific DNA endonuclease [Schizomeris leibleinii]AEH05421.1 Putative site-specific DNA endonuclease [Schizomeris leibleinii]